MKAIQLSALALAVSGTMGATQAVAEMDVDVSASVSVSNMYLFRGLDLGNGSAMVSGDLIASKDGAYGGVWATSGDASLGSEFDLFVGYATEIEGVSVDISVVNYVYPADDAADSFGDVSDIYLNVGYGPFSVDYQANVADGNISSDGKELAKAAGMSGYQYVALNGTFKQFTATLGFADYNNYSTSNELVPPGDDSGISVSDVGTDYTHLDISYAYNDNLTNGKSEVIVISIANI